MATGKQPDKKPDVVKKPEKKPTGILGMAALLDELKRAVGMVENKVESKTIDGYISLDELDVSNSLKAKLREIDANGDGKLTLEELQAALKSGLDGATLKLVTDAKDTVNKEIGALHLEALSKFSQYKSRLDDLQSQSIFPERVSELQVRATKIRENIDSMPTMLRKKPEALSLVRQQIRDFMRDVKALDPASRPAD